MKKKQAVDVVVGLGEIGRPILDILSQHNQVIGKDIENMTIPGDVRVLHICYPYEIRDFISASVNYIEEYEPELTIIHSTVVPGTTRKIVGLTNAELAYSPVRGKHSRMKEDLLRYMKFAAGSCKEATAKAAALLKHAGFTVKVVSSIDALELAKLIETTYFGLLLAWSQEVERYCAHSDVDYWEVMEFMEEIPYLPPVIFQPGHIGGHCVLPNTYLLEKLRPSIFIETIRDSNDVKKEDWLREGRDLNEILSPRQFLR